MKIDKVVLKRLVTKFSRKHKRLKEFYDCIEKQNFTKAAKLRDEIYESMFTEVEVGGEE